MSFYRARSAARASNASCLERLDQQALSRGTRILSDVGDGIVEHPAGLVGPDYVPSPRSHFRRMALSTSSWGMVRPATASA